MRAPCARKQPAGVVLDVEPFELRSQGLIARAAPGHGASFGVLLGVSSSRARRTARRAGCGGRAFVDVALVASSAWTRACIDPGRVVLAHLHSPPRHSARRLGCMRPSLARAHRHVSSERQRCAHRPAARALAPQHRHISSSEVTRARLAFDSTAPGGASHEPPSAGRTAPPGATGWRAPSHFWTDGALLRRRQRRVVLASLDVPACARSSGKRIGRPATSATAAERACVGAANCIGSRHVCRRVEVGAEAHQRQHAAAIACVQLRAAPLSGVARRILSRAIWLLSL